MKISSMIVGILTGAITYVSANNEILDFYRGIICLTLAMLLICAAKINE